MSYYNAVPAFSPDIDIVYFEEEQIYRARILSHGREFDIERGSKDEVLLELEHQLGYECELLMRYLDPDGLSRHTFKSAMREGEYSPEVGLSMETMLTAGIGIGAAMCIIMPAPALIKDALFVTKRFGGSFTSRLHSRRNARTGKGLRKRRKFATVVGGVTLVARSRRQLRKKVAQKKMHAIHLIMNAVRSHNIQRLKNKEQLSTRERNRKRAKDLPDFNESIFDDKKSINNQDWRDRTGAHRMRLIEKREAAMGLY